MSFHFSAASAAQLPRLLRLSVLLLLSLLGGGQTARGLFPHSHDWSKRSKYSGRLSRRTAVIQHVPETDSWRRFVRGNRPGDAQFESSGQVGERISAFFFFLPQPPPRRRGTTVQFCELVCVCPFTERAGPVLEVAPCVLPPCESRKKKNHPAEGCQELFIPAVFLSAGRRG